MKRCYCVFSIFGATGDLTHRKLLPALYFLEQERLLKNNFVIICIARKPKTNEEYRKEASDSIRRFSRIKVQDEVLSKLLSKIYYHQLEFANLKGYDSFKSLMENITKEKCAECERVFYLAVPSS